MYVAMNFIQARLNPLDSDAREQLSEAEYAVVRDSDLSILIQPYVIIGVGDSLYGLSADDDAHAEKRREAGRQLHVYHQAHLPPACIIVMGCDSPVLLCRCADYVLDVYHTVWYSSAHADRYVGERCRGAVAALQHHSYGNLLLQPLHLHVLP